MAYEALGEWDLAEDAFQRALARGGAPYRQLRRQLALLRAKRRAQENPR